MSRRGFQSRLRDITIRTFTQGNEFLNTELTAICAQLYGQDEARKLMPGQWSGSYLRWMAIQVAKKIIIRWEFKPPVAWVEVNNKKKFKM